MPDEMDSFLFWSVIVSSFIYAFIPTFVKLILQCAFHKEPAKVVSLRRQITNLKSELAGVSMVDEFAKYAKTQRQIRKFSEELAAQISLRSLSTMRVKVSTSAFLHVLCGLFAVYLVWYYRYEPILTVPPNWLYSINKILAFPIGTPGTVGITAWLAICSTVAKTVVRSIC